MTPLLANLNAALPDALNLVLYLAYAIGLFYVADAIFAGIRKSGDPRGVPGTKPVVALIIGGAMMSVGTIASAAVASMTGEDWTVSRTLSYFGGTPQANAHLQNMRAIMNIVMVFGYIGVVRGLMLWKAAGDGDKGGHGLDNHVISGTVMVLFSALAINMPGVLRGVAWLTGMPIPALLLQ